MNKNLNLAVPRPARVWGAWSGITAGLLALNLACGGGASSTPPPGPPGPPTSTCDFSLRGTSQDCSISYSDPIDGATTRNLRLHIPTTFAAGNALVFYMHGGGGSVSEGENNTNLSVKSDQVGYVVVYPQGTVDNTPEHKRTWNVLLPNDPSVWSGPAPDDVNFVRQMVAMVQSKLSTDPNQVFVTGLSVGGLMAHRLGVELSDVVAAVAPVSTTLHEESVPPHTVTESIKGPASVLMFLGDQDTAFPYCGVNVPQGYIAGQDETFDYWTSSLGDNCTQFDTTAKFCVNGIPNASIVEKDATSCRASGVEVQHYKLIGGGHRWYEQINVSSTCDSSTPCNPKLPKNTGETEIIWSFFSAHHKAP